MSRSRRKTPIRGLAGDSEKKDKQILHGKKRSKVRTLLKKDPENYIEPDYDELHNVWSMAKDGKMWVDKHDKKDMRK